MKRFLISTAALALMSSAALAADMVEIVDVPVDVAHDWSGVYVGANIGAAWAQQDDGDSGCDVFTNLTGEHGGAPTYDSAECYEAQTNDEYSRYYDSGSFQAFDLDGDYIGFDGFDDGGGDDVRFMGGLQLGINQQYGRLVVGLETDISWIGGGDNDRGGSFDYFHSHYSDGGDYLYNYEGTGTVSIENQLDWLATFRARAGGTFGNEGRLLIYGTAGVGVAGVKNRISGSWDDAYEYSRDWCDREGDCQFGDGDDGDDYKVGVALGLGAEYAFNDNLSFGLEYLYVGFGDNDNDNSITFFGDDGRSFDIKSNGGLDNIQTIRAKVNWKFKPH